MDSGLKMAKEGRTYTAVAVIILLFLLASSRAALDVLKQTGYKKISVQDDVAPFDSVVTRSRIRCSSLCHHSSTPCNGFAYNSTTSGCSLYHLANETAGISDGSGQKSQIVHANVQLVFEGR